MLAQFPLVLLCKGGNLQSRCQQFSASSFLVRFHCTYLLLFNRRDPDNTALLHVCLSVCIRVTIETNKIDKLCEDTVGPCLQGKNGCLLWGQDPTQPKKFYGSSIILLVIMGYSFI